MTTDNQLVQIDGEWRELLAYKQVLGVHQYAYEDGGGYLWTRYSYTPLPTRPAPEAEATTAGGDGWSVKHWYDDKWYVVRDREFLRKDISTTTNGGDPSVDFRGMAAAEAALAKWREKQAGPSTSEPKAQEWWNLPLTRLEIRFNNGIAPRSPVWVCAPNPEDGFRLVYFVSHGGQQLSSVPLDALGCGTAASIFLKEMTTSDAQAKPTLGERAKEIEKGLLTELGRLDGWLKDNQGRRLAEKIHNLASILRRHIEQEARK